MNKRKKNGTRAHTCLWFTEQCCCYGPPDCCCDSDPSFVSIEQIVTWVVICSLIYLLFNTIKLLIIILLVLSLLYWTGKWLPISRWMNQFFGTREPPEAPSGSIDDQTKSRAEVDSRADAERESRDSYTIVNDDRDNETKRTTGDTTVGCNSLSSLTEYAALFHRQTQ